MSGPPRQARLLIGGIAHQAVAMLAAMAAVAGSQPAFIADMERKQSHRMQRQRRLYGGGNVKPHCGRQEMLRRRYGGNAKRIREARLGNLWNDVKREYQPLVGDLTKEESQMLTRRFERWVLESFVDTELTSLYIRYGYFHYERAGHAFHIDLDSVKHLGAVQA